LPKKSISRVSEKIIQTEILTYLRVKNYFHKRIYLGPVLFSGGKRAKNPLTGMPDIIGAFKDGKMFAIECKASKGGVLSIDQELTINEMRKNNILVIIAKSLDEVILTFAKAGY
jgi:hypothetical protein